MTWTEDRKGTIKLRKPKLQNRPKLPGFRAGADDYLGDNVFGLGGGGHASHCLRLRRRLRGQTNPTRQTG